MYYLNKAMAATKNVFSHTMKECHRIMGHCNTNDILGLEKVVEGMKITNRNNFVCEICIRNKMPKFRNRNDRRATEPLKYVISISQVQSLYSK